MIEMLGVLFTTPQILFLIGGGVVVVLVTGLIETLVNEWNRWSRYYKHSNSWRRK